MENGQFTQMFKLQSEKLEEVQQTVIELLRSLRPLAEVGEDLKAIENGLRQIETEMKLLRHDLVGAAVGNDRVPKSSLDAVAKVYMGINKALCAVIVFVTIWFTGLKYIAPQIFGGK